MLQPRCMNSVASQSSNSGMRGAVALRAEIIAGENDAAPEDFLPDAVHRDARRQRMVGRDQPVGQSEAPALAGGHGRQHGERAGLNFGAAIAPVAFDVDVGLGRRIVLEQHRRVADRRELCRKLVQLYAQFWDFQRVAVFLPVEVAARAEEHVQHGVLLHFAAFRGVEEEHLSGVVYGVRDLAVSEIPIVVDAGVECGFAQLGFVVRQILGDLVLVEQRLALAVVLGLGGEVGAEFAR